MLNSLTKLEWSILAIIVLLLVGAFALAHHAANEEAERARACREAGGDWAVTGSQPSVVPVTSIGSNGVVITTLVPGTVDVWGCRQ